MTFCIGYGLTTVWGSGIVKKIKTQLKSTMIEVAWFISRRQDAFRCRRLFLKGRHAERMQVPEAVFLGHRVKNSMTVIELRWRAILKEDSLGLPAAVLFFCYRSEIPHFGTAGSERYRRTIAKL